MTFSNDIEKIKLPKPEFNEKISFWKTTQNRHSTREFKDKPLTLMEMSLLLFGMSGLTRIFPQYAFRTAPSAGGLYPIETYPIVNNVDNLKQGIYHYNIPEHALELLKEGDFRHDVTEGALGQEMTYKSAINFIWTAVIERSKWKYLQRCYRYIYGLWSYWSEFLLNC